MQHTTRSTGVPGWLVVALVTLAGVWAVGVTLAFQALGWFVEQVLIISELAYPWAVWPLLSLVNAALVAVAVVPAALIVQRPRLRPVAQTWALATACLPVLGLVRAMPIARNEYAAAALAVVAGALAAGVYVLTRRRAGNSLAGVLIGCALGLVTLLPWWWLGALGSATETALTALAALAVGALGAMIVARVAWPAFAAVPTPRWQHIVVGGLAAGVALVLVVAGAGPAGTQLVLLLAIPPTGFVLAALAAARAPGWVPATAILGLASLGALTFVDPEELAIFLGDRDVGFCALVASLASGGLALVGAGALWLAAALGQRRAAAADRRAVAGDRREGPDAATDRRDDAAPRRRLALGTPARRAVAAATVAAVLASGLAVHAAAGSPGFHGERLFVILKAQEDVSDLADRTNLDERRREVYQRLVTRADDSQRELRRALDDRGVPYTPYYLVNAVEVPDSPALRAWLADRPEVARVLDSPRLRPIPLAPEPDRGDQTSPPAEPEWNIAELGVPRVWAELKIDGRGVVVGESDSGVDGRHPALRDNYRGRDGSDDYHWFDPWNDSRSPTDAAGHGTHTTATAVGRQNVGVAPGAEWIGCVNLARNLGNPAYYLDCLQFMLAPFPNGGDPLRDGDPSRAADVLNNSWGCPKVEGCDPNALLQAARALKAAGIFTVVSAGNAGPRCSSIADPLALYDEAFTVGASDKAGKVTDFSSRGPVTADGSGRRKPDLLAPGADILSALPGGGYGPNDGTSMAGPHVAGVVALMWQANPELVGDIDGTADLLRESTKPATGGGLGSDCGGTENLAGAGIVDAYAAVTAAQRAR